MADQPLAVNVLLTTTMEDFVVVVKTFVSLAGDTSCAWAERAPLVPTLTVDMYCDNKPKATDVMLALCYLEGTPKVNSISSDKLHSTHL